MGHFLKALATRALLLLALFVAPGGTLQAYEAFPLAPGNTFLAQQGRTFFVSPQGDDHNPGTRERPWASPAYGASKLQPGDTLILLGGRYVLSDYERDIMRPPSGTKDAWITIKGEPGNRPILAGRNNLYTAIDLSGVRYLILENIEITHDSQASGAQLRSRDGITIAAEPAGPLVLRHLYVHHLDEFGLNAQDIEDVEILYCEFSHCGFGAIGGPAGEQGG
ncbi:MAG: hypothetical protein J7M05_11365 [Anaerolineae bacterium]|nr:hypothetical protein [Anaerolineae bacterium]